MTSNVSHNIKNDSNLLMQSKQNNFDRQKYLHIQEISPSNTIHAFDVEYSLDDLSLSHLFSTTAQYLFNGQNALLPTSTTLEKKHENEHIMTVYNGQNEIRSIIIHDKVRRRTEEFVSIGHNQIATVSSNKYYSKFLNTNLKKLFHFAIGLLNYSQENDEIVSGRIKNPCTEYNVIDLAVVYDSSYCYKVDGKENAEAEIAGIVSLVSNKFEQDGLCLKVEISYLEGYCDVALDPYRTMVRDGVDSNNLLNDFRLYWMNNRKDVNRTVTHLFTATTMADSTLGRGYTGVLCSESTAYAVEEVSWSPELLMKVAVVAHELGHNVGASHLDDCDISSDFLMQPSISEGISGFSEESIEQMRTVIDSRSCMKTVPA